MRSNLLADTCCDLLSIWSTMDLLLRPGSLCRSTTIGARVAPFSPVGCTAHHDHHHPNPLKKTADATTREEGERELRC